MVVATEKSLFETIDVYRVIVEGAEEGIWIADKDDDVTFVNKKMADMLGYPRDEIIGKKIFDFTDEKNRAIMKESIEHSRKGGRDIYTFSLRNKIGRFIPLIVATTPVQDEKGQYIGTVQLGSDITVQKTSQEALRDSEERFRTLADNIPVMVWMANPDGWIFWYNMQWYDYTGTTLEETQGWGWHKVHHPDYVEAVTEEWKSCLKADVPFDKIFPLRGKDGNYRWFLTRVTPIRDAQGKIYRWFGTNTDITERKQAEEELANAKAKAEFYLDIMGHDINNLNQITMGFLEIALDSLDLNPEQKEFIERPLESLRSSSRLINNVRKLQKAETGELPSRTIDLCDILDELKNRYSHMPPERKITVNFKRINPCYIIANELINDLLSNLIENAIKHSEPDKALIINLGLEKVAMDDKDYYQISVDDNGPGISDEFKPKLFTRFSRGETKAIGKGLGLYIARTLVKDFHGKVWVEDRVPGDHTKGARFVVMLPAAEQ